MWFAKGLFFFPQRRFVKLDSGCNGVVFVQMRKKDGDRSPKDIVHRIVTSAASTGKHMSRYICSISFSIYNHRNTNAVLTTSRFILRILPIEVSCYASKEEISRAIKPLVEQYFPVETQNPHKVIYCPLVFQFVLHFTFSTHSKLHKCCQC